MSNWLKLALLGAAVAVVVGCGKPPADDKAAKDKEKDKGKQTEADKEKAQADAKKHGEWWCDEHGVPEDECGMCHSNVAKKIKKEDQCPKHEDRTKDQCFICYPEKWPASAARYKARYPGKEPPEPIDENKLTKK